jgi:V/A-type H+/Na+-transporting ATPase subunit E
MKGLETGKDKVKKICDLLKRETLEPAQIEAQDILEAAKLRSEEIIAEAHRKAEEMHQAAHQEIQQQRTVFQASLAQACRQTLDSLKEKIEQKLFNPELVSLLSKPLQDPKVIARLIEVIVTAIEKEGTHSNLSASISSAVSAREVNTILAAKILEKLKEKSVLLTSIGGGVEVKIVDQNMTIDLSDTAFKELVANYIRKDFRDLIFNK